MYVSHGKTDLKVLVVVIPKKGLAGWSPTNLSLGMTATIKYYSIAFVDYNSVVGVIPKKGLAGPKPANPSLGMTTTKTLRYHIIDRPGCQNTMFRVPPAFHMI